MGVFRVRGGNVTRDRVSVSSFRRIHGVEREREQREVVDREVTAFVSLLLASGERKSERVDNRVADRNEKFGKEKRKEEKICTRTRIDIKVGRHDPNNLDYAKMSYDSITKASVNVLKRADARYHSPCNSISLK